MNFTKRIASIDAGSGYNKYVYDDCGVYEIKEELSGFAKVEQTSKINPENADHILSLDDGQTYYSIGENSIYFGAGSHISTDNYNNLKFMTPYIIKRYLNQLAKEGKEWDLVATGISLAYMDNDKDFKEHICSTLGLPEDKLVVIPQGIGAKYCFTHYGTNIQGNNQMLIKSYLGIDIGYNSTDFFYVVDDKLTGNKITGDEQTGIVVLNKKVKEEAERRLKEKTGDDIILSDAHVKQLLSDKKLVFQSKGIDLTDFINEEIKVYLNNMSKIINEKFKYDMATIQKLVIFGGAGTLLKSNMSAVEEVFDKGFIIIPEKPQFYNAVGYCLAAQVL